LKTSVWDQLQITNQQLQIPSNFSAAHAAGKWFGYREPRVARSEVRALSGAGTDDLVALETWRSGNEIANLK
jgi:hypothetical protein